MPGRVEQEPASERPRLVQQPDGYADYVDDVRAPGQHRAAAGSGQHRATAARSGQVVGPVPRRHAASAQPSWRRRQRSIRSTVTMLLIIPLVTLIGLLAYSLTATIPGVLASNRDTAVNNDISGPLQDVLTQLNTEAALTYTLSTLQDTLQAAAAIPPAQQKQPARPPSPSVLRQKEAQLKAAREQVTQLGQELRAQRPVTDSAIAAFRAGQSKADGSSLLDRRARALATAFLGQLDNVQALRNEADHRPATALTVFQGYLGVVDAIFPYVAAVPNTHTPVPMFSQLMGTLFMGQALTDVSAESVLGTGAIENGGVLTGPAYRLFAQTAAAHRQLDQVSVTMLTLQDSAGTDAHVAVLNSPQFKSFAALEDRIIAAGPTSVFPATLLGWQQQTSGVLRLLENGVTRERLTVTANIRHNRDVEEYELYGVSGTGLLLVLVSSLLLLRFGNRVSRELRALRGAAQGLAFQRLPGVVSRLRVGEDLDAAVEAPSLHLGAKTLEVTETAEAFSAVQRTAVQAAIEQAVLRKAVSNVFRRLARRNHGLLQRQLKMLDEMERGTHDPDALGQLFRLDHLTTRMRRQAEGLIILSGAAPGRGWRQPVQVVEVLRGAIGEIEDYVRVDLSTDSPDYLQGPSVADVTHLLAELIENAVAYSPPTTRVQVRGGRVANGYVVEVEDRGLGVPAEVRDTLNQRLAEPPDFDVADSDQLGLFVVSRLAARHDIKVSLHPSSYGGTRAIVLLPPALVVTPEEAEYLASQENGGGAGRRQTGPIDTNGGRGGRMAAAVGIAADALTGRRRRPGTGPLSTGHPSGPLPMRHPSGPIPTGHPSGPLPTVHHTSGPMAALDGSPSLPSRADRPTGVSFPGAVGGHPGSGQATGGFPRASGPFAAPPGPGPGGHVTPGGRQDPPGGPVAAGSDGAPALPRRERMASLAPQLRDEPPNAPRGPMSGKSPEQARALLSDIQRGLRTGRDANVEGNGPSGPDGGKR